MERNSAVKWTPRERVIQAALVECRESPLCLLDYIEAKRPEVAAASNFDLSTPCDHAERHKPGRTWA